MFERTQHNEENLSILRHLEDENNLFSGRDTDIVPGQEEIVYNIASEIISEADARGYGVIFFSCSPRKRTLQTVELIKQSILLRSDHLKVSITTNDKLVDMDHGKFVLPKNYKHGDVFEPFNLAWKIFWDETFNKDNPDYHLGDCVKQQDGTILYPDLFGYWTSFGESYKEICIRLYSSILEFSENIDRFNIKTMPIIMTHGGSLAIFRELENIAIKIKTEGYTFPTGQLMKICWNNYQSRQNRTSSDFGKILKLSIETLRDPEIIKKLKEEVNFLTSTKK